MTVYVEGDSLRKFKKVMKEALKRYEPKRRDVMYVKLKNIGEEKYGRYGFSYKSVEECENKSDIVIILHEYDDVHNDIIPSKLVKEIQDKAEIKIFTSDSRCIEQIRVDVYSVIDWLFTISRGIFKEHKEYEDIYAMKLYELLKERDKIEELEQEVEKDTKEKKPKKNKDIQIEKKKKAYDICKMEPKEAMKELTLKDFMKYAIIRKEFHDIIKIMMEEE